MSNQLLEGSGEFVIGDLVADAVLLELLAGLTQGYVVSTDSLVFRAVLLLKPFISVERLLFFGRPCEVPDEDA